MSKFGLSIAAVVVSVALQLVDGKLLARNFRAADAEEIDSSVSQAEPGDTITLKDGEWRDVDILFDAHGTAEQPITLRAETPGKVIISGKSRLRIAADHLIVDGLFFKQAYDDDNLIAFRKNSERLASHCRLTNCAIVDCNAPDAKNESRWIAIYGQHNRLDHCWIEGKLTKGTTVAVVLDDGPAQHRIDHNYFGPRPRLGQNGGETIRVGDSKTAFLSARVIVEQNVFERCDGESEIISNKSCDNVYRHNTFLRSSGALTLRHGHRATVEGNFFLGQKARGTGGVRIIGEGHRVVNNYFADLEGDDSRAALSIMQGIENSPAAGYQPVKGALVAFNTFVDCKQTIVVGLGDGYSEARVPPEGCTLANNLIVSRRPAIDLRCEPIDFVWRTNLVESAAAVPELAGVSKVDDLRLELDPSDLWRPTQQSAAIGAATPIHWIEHDIDGHRRKPPQDVGCDELIDAPPHVPLTPDDVGPKWKADRG